MIVFSCSSCGKNLRVKDELAGKKCKCPHCGQISAVPAVKSQSPVAAPSGELKTLLPGGEAAGPAKEDATLLRTESRGAASGVGQSHMPSTVDQSTSARGALHDFLAPPQGPGELGRLGAYRVLKVLGAGGMGVVFQAEDPQLKRQVALKVMLPALAASDSARKRFLREAQAAAAIEHDHIVAIHQVGEDRGVPFLAMPFLKGEALDERLNRGEPGASAPGALPLAEVVRIGREAAEGLAAAHERGLIHRDIKPANLWLEGKSGRVKILDFGLARAMGDESHLTQQGAIIGTPAYMAPEQANGETVDARCDLFSLGCILYRMVTGQLPFMGKDTVSMLMAVVTENPRPPQELNPLVPRALADLVLQLLSKKPAERPASAQEVADRLRAIALDRTESLGKAQVKKTSGPQKTATSAPRRRRVLVLAGAAMVLLALGLTAGFLFRNGSNPKDNSQEDSKTDPKNKEELLTPTSDPLSPLTLVMRPAQIPGVRSWTLVPRGHLGRLSSRP